MKPSFQAWKEQGKLVIKDCCELQNDIQYRANSCPQAILA